MSIDGIPILVIELELDCMQGLRPSNAGNIFARCDNLLKVDNVSNFCNMKSCCAWRTGNMGMNNRNLQCNIVA